MFPLCATLILAARPIWGRSDSNEISYTLDAVPSFTPRSTEEDIETANFIATVTQPAPETTNKTSEAMNLIHDTGNKTSLTDSALTESNWIDSLTEVPRNFISDAVNLIRWILAAIIIYALVKLTLRAAKCVRVLAKCGKGCAGCCSNMDCGICAKLRNNEFRRRRGQQKNVESQPTREGNIISAN